MPRAKLARIAKESLGLARAHILAIAESAAARVRNQCPVEAAMAGLSLSQKRKDRAQKSRVFARGGSRKFSFIILARHHAFMYDISSRAAA